MHTYFDAFSAMGSGSAIYYESDNTNSISDEAKDLFKTRPLKRRYSWQTFYLLFINCNNGISATSLGI